MGVISVLTISKELMLACRQLGHAVSETLATLVASTIVNQTLGSFYVERPIDESDARIVVEEAAKRILSKERPGIATMRLQASYESSNADIELANTKHKNATKAVEDRVLGRITGFTAKFDQDFDTLTGLYKDVYNFLLLRCTSPAGATSWPKDPVIEREVAAALESVFPRIGLRSFVALSGPEKSAQLQELSSIVLGIRLFNLHQRKGGAGLPSVEGAADRLKSADFLQTVQTEAEEVSEICKAFAGVVQAAKRAASKPGLKHVSDSELELIRNDLLYHRQYLIFLLNIQEDVGNIVDRLRKGEKSLTEELIDLDALIGGRVSVPKEQVYPRFDSVARNYRTTWQEVRALEAQFKLHGVLRDLRKQYFPQLSATAQELLNSKEHQGSLTVEVEDEEHIDLDTIPGPSRKGDPADGRRPVRLTVNNCDNFLQLPLDFQGFCIHTMVSQNGLLVPGNPALGVIWYAGRYCVFATERSYIEFCTEPDQFFAGVREACYKKPELIHLLRVNQEDFPKSSLLTIIQMTSGNQAVMQADAGTETPLHFQESHIDKTYEWNEWAMRKEALHMADIRRKATSATQTALSHLRRETETQVYLPKDMATNTGVNRGTNPSRLLKYHTCLRGEPQPMKVVEMRFDL